MKQIYYTQCPIGYGLGASNGFQIKRLSPGYALTSDFRQLGLRAFIPGTRQMAPPVLRYRRTEAGTAEVAFLTPRSHEYETERGPWGRPGGHFAHGLQFDEGELGAIQNWPAGLFDAPFWVRSDRAPTREEAPPPLTLSEASLRWPPLFEEVGQLGGLCDSNLLARLFTALAVVVREGRTVFLIAEANRLAECVAFLTFAFPRPYRGALTFSTYHDRPEEQPGLRLQGMSPLNRPNRTTLLSLGIVVDLERGQIEPEISAEPWSHVLADWFTRRSERDREAWSATDRFALRACRREPSESIWTLAWLDRLLALESAFVASDSSPDWNATTDLAPWCGRVGLGDDWARARDPDWWLKHAGTGQEAVHALVGHLQLSEAWPSPDNADAWGRVAARWLEREESGTRASIANALFQAAPSSIRISFVRATLLTVPAPIANELLEALKTQPEFGPALLIPLEVRGAVAGLRENASTRPLLALLRRSLAYPETLKAILETLATAIDTVPETRTPVANAIADWFDSADPQARTIIQSWALRRDDAAAWLGPTFRRAFANPLNVESWREIRERTPASLLNSLARVVLSVANEETLPDESFRWGIEDLLLTIPEPERPHDPAWPSSFLTRTPSDLDLIRWLYVKRHYKPHIKAWLSAARGRGELTAEQEERLDACASYARVLRSGDARALLDVRLPIVPAEERGAVLSQILGRIGTDSTNGFDLVLDAVRDAWPGGFDAGVPGLDGLGQALAPALQPLGHDPPRWLERVRAILAHLKVSGEWRGFEHNGLAAAILVATSYSGDESLDPWPLRQFVLQSPDAWRILAGDARRGLSEATGLRSVDALRRWDAALAKGLHTARFFEIWLNACDAQALSLAVIEYAGALKNLDLPWWDHQRYQGARDDLRDAFARQAPMVPIPAAALLAIEKWIVPAIRPSAIPIAIPVRDEDGLVPLGEGASYALRYEGGEPRLSAHGKDRWSCLKALGEFNSKGIEAIGRWGRLLEKRLAESLSRLDAEDRYRFLAWLIHLSDEFDELSIPKLAKWLYRAGLTDVERYGSWPDELAELTAVPGESALRKAPMIAELRDELKRVILDESARP